jgi:hypothetical protein
VFDEIYIVDDFSTDGSVEWLKSVDSSKIHIFQRKFDDCPHQFDFILQQCPKDNTWIWCATPDELPTDWWFENIRKVLDEADTKNIDRIWATVYHLRSERECANEIGGEIRLFRNDEHHKCWYTDYPHERLDGKFDGHCASQLDERLAFVHFKQADKDKLDIWKTDYVEKGVYRLWDVNRRLNIPSIPLPEHIEYSITPELRKYLGW